MAPDKGKRKAWTDRIRKQPGARPADRIRHRGNRFEQSGGRWSKAGANAVPAIGCRFENMRRPDFLDWRARRAAAAQPKKMNRTHLKPSTAAA